MYKKQSKNYCRVMSRVYNRSSGSVKSSSVVTRHEIPSSVRVGAKPSVSNVSSNVFRELPTVLNDYTPEVDRGKVLKRTNVVKPKRTLKSLVPERSPPRLVLKPQKVDEPRLNIRAHASSSFLSKLDRDKWSDRHVRQCYSSRSHSKLKEIKDEIKVYAETEKKMRLRSQLYKSCGVVLNDVGEVAKDKGVQVEVETETEKQKEIR